jgi:uncharacterized protein (DUF58 family)
MTKRALVLLIIFVVLAAIAVQTQNRLFFSMAYLTGATLIFSFLWAFLNLRWVGVSRMTTALRAQVASPVEERIVIHNKGPLPKLWLEVQDHSELPTHHASRVVHGVGPRRQRGWNVKTLARYRGRYRLGPMTLVSGDPFGLFTFRRELPQTSAVTIFPATYPIPSFTPPTGRLTGGEIMRRRTHNTTPNFSSVRDYVPGDTLNKIHWKSTARTGRLIVKEFEEDPNADIWVVLDMHKETHLESTEEGQSVSTNGSGPKTVQSGVFPWIQHEKLPEILPSTTEYSVVATASIMRHFLDQNRAVGMITHAEHREIIQPDRGVRPLTRALEQLAVLQPVSEMRLADVLTLEEVLFSRGTTLIVVTSAPSKTWVDVLTILQRRGVKAIAVLINPASFQRYAPSMDEVQGYLAMANIPFYVVNKDVSMPLSLSSQSKLAPRPVLN